MDHRIEMIYPQMNKKPIRYATPDESFVYINSGKHGSIYGQ